MPSIYLREAKLLLAGAAAYSMSTLFSAMKPVLLTRFVDENGWSDALAGLAVAMPFVGIALAAFVAPAASRRYALRTLALALGSVLVLSEILSALNPGSVLMVLLLQLAGGIAVGVLMGAGSRIVATRATPGALFGAIDMVAVLLMSSMIAAVGAAVGYAGLAGGYGVAAVIAFGLTLLMLPFDGKPAVRSKSSAPTPLVVTPRALAVVSMGVVFVSCSGLGFTYMFSVAQSLGISYASAGAGIGVLLLVSALACLVGGWVSSRFGSTKPLAVAFLTCALGWYWVIHAPNASVFYIALVPAVFSLQFNFPVLLDLAGSLDEEGQWGAIAAPLQTSGFAWAAILAGTLVGAFGLTAIPVATGAGMCVCLALLWIATSDQAPSGTPERAR
ncbi:MAG: MFS transporter [Pseudomonadota bacterium]